MMPTDPRVPSPDALEVSQAIEIEQTCGCKWYGEQTICEPHRAFALALEAWGAERDAENAALREMVRLKDAALMKLDLWPIAHDTTKSRPIISAALRLTPASVAERARLARAVVEAVREFDKGYSFQQHNPSAALRLRKALAALDHTEGTR
jgi:hypothetical protein